MHSHLVSYHLTHKQYRETLHLLTPWQKGRQRAPSRGVGTKKILGGGRGRTRSTVLYYSLIVLYNILYKYLGAAAPSAPSFLRHCQVVHARLHDCSCVYRNFISSVEVGVRRRISIVCRHVAPTTLIVAKCLPTKFMDTASFSITFLCTPILMCVCFDVGLYFCVEPCVRVCAFFRLVLSQSQKSLQLVFEMKGG